MDKIRNRLLSLNVSWLFVLVFAVAAGAYTALINQVPFLENTSFRDMAVSHEWWVFFALIIIFNQKGWLQAGLKTFVFFIISQSVVFLVEWPFAGEFFTPYWIRWMEVALVTLPGGAVMWFAKRNNVLGNLLLALPLALLLALAGMYGLSAVQSFPRHILTCLFCLAQIAFWLYAIAREKKQVVRTVLFTVGVVGIVAAWHYLFPAFSPLNLIS